MRDRSRNPGGARGATLLSLLLPGAGQMMLNQYAKGAAMLIGCLLLAYAGGLLAILVVWPLAALDAYQVAVKRRLGAPLGRWELFPSFGLSEPPDFIP